MKNLKILHLEDSLADAELIRLELDEYLVFFNRLFEFYLDYFY